MCLIVGVIWMFYMPAYISKTYMYCLLVAILNLYAHFLTLYRHCLQLLVTTDIT